MSPIRDYRAQRRATLIWCGVLYVVVLLIVLFTR